MWHDVTRPLAPDEIVPGPLDVERLRAYQVAACRDIYEPAETMLYAVGVGAGMAAVDETGFVFEEGLTALPTMALTLGTPGFWPTDPATGLNWPQILHGEQSFRLHRPLEPQGDVCGHTTIGALCDKGVGKPGLLCCTRELTDAVTGAAVASLEEVWVLRGAGGFGGENRPVSAPILPVPERAAEAMLDLPTAPNQAMLYRLTGDRNPLHVDRRAAAAGGFDRPILHGLATMGVVGRALIQLACDGDARRLSAMRLRFTAPVLPGETIRTEIWRDGAAIRFRATVPARATVVIDGGTAELDGFDG